MDRVAEVIRATDPDVALLNEVLGGAGSRLARATNRHLVFGMTLPLQRFGNAVLLRGRPGRVVRGRFSRTKGLERRGFVGTDRGDGCLVVAAHLSTRHEDHARHASELLHAVEDYDRVVLGCDLNEGPGGPAGQVIRARFTDAFVAKGKGSGETFPADAPMYRIDYVFCSRSLTPRRAAVVPLIASDHLAVIADID